MIIFLSGKSHRLMLEKLEHLSVRFAKKFGPAGQIIRKSLDTTTHFDELKNLIGTPSLFASKQLIVFRNVFGLLAGEQAKFLTFLKKNNLPEGTTLIFTEPEPLPKISSSVLLKYFKQSTRVKKMVADLARSQLPVQDLITRADNLGARLELPAVNFLLGRTGKDYDQAIFEIEKLALFAAARPGKTISQEDVEQTVQAKTESDIFKTIDALGQRDLKLALTLLHRHIDQGAHPLYLLTMLRYQFKTLIQVADAQKQSNDPRVISEITKLSPFVVRKSMSQLSNYRGRDLKKIFVKLVDADEAIKTSRVEGVVALDLLTFALAN